MRILMLLLFSVCLLAEEARKEVHLSVEQQRDFAEVVGDANAAQLEATRMMALAKAKADELKSFCGGQITRDKDGHWDCKAK